MKKLRISLLLITALFIVQCKSKQFPTREIPENFQIEMRKSSGMIAEGYTIKIDAGKRSIFVSLYSSSGYPEKSFTTTKPALDSLYQFIAGKNIDTYTYTVNKQVMDRGGREILLIYPDEKILVSNKGVNFLDEQYLKDFRQVANYIETWTNNHTGNFLKQ